jgi:hypothetical protein
MIKSLSKITNGEKMTTGEIIKTGLGLVISLGTDIAVCSLFGHFIGGKGAIRILGKIGAAILAMKAGEDAEEYFYKIFDETKDALDEAKVEVDKIVMEPKDEGGH